MLGRWICVLLLTAGCKREREPSPAAPPSSDAARARPGAAKPAAKPPADARPVAAATVDAALEDGTFACPLDGLADGRVRVSDEEGKLELLAGDEVRAAFELGDEVKFNAAKGEVTCDGKSIELESQMPYSAYFVKAELRWDGKRLSVASLEEGDPSADALDEVESDLAAGKIEDAVSALEEMEYPGHYIDPGELATRVLRRAHAVALERNRAGHPAAAAAALEAGLEWAELAGRSEVPEKLVVLAKNDRGFFLDRAGKHAEAESVLREVIAAAPDRAVAHLNLADCLQAQKKVAEARAAYAAYASRTPRSRWPERVAKRCPDCEPPKP